MMFGHDDRRPDDIKNYLEEHNRRQGFKWPSIIVLALIAVALLFVILLLQPQAQVDWPPPTATELIAGLGAMPSLHESPPPPTRDPASGPTAPSELIYIPEVVLHLTAFPDNTTIVAVVHARMTMSPALVWYPTATPTAPPLSERSYQQAVVTSTPETETLPEGPYLADQGRGGPAIGRHSCSLRPCGGTSGGSSGGGAGVVPPRDGDGRGRGIGGGMGGGPFRITLGRVSSQIHNSPRTDTSLLPPTFTPEPTSVPPTSTPKPRRLGGPNPVDYIDWRDLALRQCFSASAASASSHIHWLEMSGEDTHALKMQFIRDYGNPCCVARHSSGSRFTCVH